MKFKKELFIRNCPILSCYIIIIIIIYNIYIIIIIMYNSFQPLFALFIVLCLRPLQKMDPCIVFWFSVLFCIRFFLVFSYRPRMFFVSLAIFHLSDGCPFIVYDLVKLWSAAALVTDRPPAPTHKTEHITRISLLTSAMKGFSACFFLSAHLLQALSPDEREADNADKSAHL